jgi:hypothetical protein
VMTRKSPISRNFYRRAADASSALHGFRMVPPHPHPIVASPAVATELTHSVRG